MKRKSLILGGSLVAVVAAILTNGYLTHRYSMRYQAASDLINAASFLGAYAAEHNDSLPSSWDDLVASGFVVSDPKYPARFAGYYQNSLNSPEKIRWLSNANLETYVDTKTGVVLKRTGEPCRLLWLDGMGISGFGESEADRYLLQTWREWREHPSSAASGK